MISSKVGKFLSNFDQFGAISKISFLNKQPKYITIYGGVLTLLIYTSAMVYSVYLMMMWWTVQIQPTVTSQQQYHPGLTNFKLTKAPFIFSLEVDGVTNETDPIYLLQQKGNIFDYKVVSEFLPHRPQTILNKNAPEYQCWGDRKVYDFFNQICINMNDDDQTMLQADATNRAIDTYIDVFVQYCDPDKDNNCLSFNDQEAIFNAHSYWRLTLITQAIDLKTRQIRDIPQDLYFDVKPYQNTSAQQIQLTITQATYIIDTGILFANEEVIKLISSIEVNKNQIQGNDPVTNVPLIAQITYNMSKNEQVVRITYTKLAQILAQLGSIFQTLLLLGMIMNMFNDSLMEVKIEETLLKIYFPQIRQFQFKYNWRGKVCVISTKEKVLEKTEFERIKQFAQTVGKQVRSKMNFMSILNDICRIQVQMQKSIPPDQFKQLNQVGYRVDLKSLDLIRSINIIDDIGLLDYKDFLLSLSSTGHILSGQVQQQNDQLKILDELLFVNPVESPVINVSPQLLQQNHIKPPQEEQEKKILEVKQDNLS